MAGYFDISENLEMFDDDMEMPYNEEDILSQIPPELLDQLTPEMLEELQYQNPALFEQIMAASQHYDDRVFVLLDNIPVVMDQCLLPVVHNAVQIVLPLFLLSLFCKLFQTSVAKNNHFIVNLVNTLSGFAVLYFYSKVAVPFVLFAVLLYSLLCYLFEAFSLKRRSRAVALVYFITLSLCNFLVDAEAWHQAMGPQIVLCMKILSLEFDLESGTVKQDPDVDAVLGYLFHPGTVVFGPWVSFTEYQMTFLSLDPKSWLLSVLDAIKFAVLSVFCLAYSNCFTNFLLGPGANIWLKAYFVAQGFRTSHYFVQYIASMTAAVGGFSNKPCDANHSSENSINANRNTTETSHSSNGNSGHAVKNHSENDSRKGKYVPVLYVNPFGVELPRSMGAIANNWNLFMNKWFKKYVFQQLLHNSTESSKGNSGGGVFKAVIAVYVVSSLLHGAKFQVSAVLLTIGMVSYAEYELRRKLSRIYSACVHCSPCESKCSKHKYKWNNPVVLTINLLFSLFNGAHLIYLGAPFDNSDLSSVGYSYQHTMAVWANLQYASHYAFFFIYALAKII